jgi:hypothetical protein
MIGRSREVGCNNQGPRNDDMRISASPAGLAGLLTAERCYAHDRCEQRDQRNRISMSCMMVRWPNSHSRSRAFGDDMPVQQGAGELCEARGREDPAGLFAWRRGGEKWLCSCGCVPVSLCARAERLVLVEGVEKSLLCVRDKGEDRRPQVSVLLYMRDIELAN